MGAGAATATYEINGTMGKNEHSCSAPINSLRDVDCSYARTQLSLNEVGDDEGYVWVGPTRNGGYYAVGSAGDSLDYNPNDANPATPEIFEPDNIKVEPVVVGTVVIDDNDTPDDGTDDTVRLTFSIQGPTPTAGIVRNVSVGETTRAIERWQSLDQSMTDPYPVDGAIPNASGGFDYIIGSRGTPTRICNASDPNDCFPSNNFNRRTNNPTPFEPSFWAPVPAPGSVGIERSPQIANRPGIGPNVGLQMVGVFRDRVPGTNTAAYTCLANGATDCAAGQLVWGSAAQNTAALPAFPGNRGPGFDNMVGVISTSPTGIETAFFYWTQEFQITAFAPGTTSSQTGTIEFTGIRSTTDPTAVPDAVNVVQGTSGNIIDVLANDRNLPPEETTVTVTVAPNQGGSATVNPDGTISYTPLAPFSGTETFTYQAAIDRDGVELTSSALVTVTVQPDTNPVGGNVPLAINTQGRSGAAAAATYTFPASSLGNQPATVTLTSTGTAGKGTCTVSGTAITYTPVPAFVDGGDTDSCGFSITDLDGDNAVGTLNVTITDVAPILNDAAPREVDAGDTATADATFTAGNGVVADHTLAVTTPATSGSCAVSVVGSNVRVTYTANDDAGGDDFCDVTLTDADGDSDTGRFTFNVISTGVTLPGGGSAMDPWSLLLLGGLPVLARRRRR